MSLPGSPVTVAVVPGAPCADASIPSVLPSPFQQCDALTSPAGAGLVFDIAMRDCLGNPTMLSADQVRLLESGFPSALSLCYCCYGLLWEYWAQCIAFSADSNSIHVPSLLLSVDCIVRIFCCYHSQIIIIVQKLVINCHRSVALPPWLASASLVRSSSGLQRRRDPSLAVTQGSGGVACRWQIWPGR